MPDLPLRKQGSPHDHFIKGIAKYKEALCDLPLLLPKSIVNQLSVETVNLGPGSYIDEQLSSSYSDLLLSCKFAGKPGFLYLLFEHQSKPERNMSWRVTDYSVQIVKNWRKKNPGKKLFPAVVPVVLYQSRRPWNAPTSFRDLMIWTREPNRSLRRFCLAAGLFWWI
jgi:predicted transposase/invertase (TIGR01784 family)